MTELTSVIAISVLLGVFLWLLFEYKMLADELNRSKQWENFYREEFFKLRKTLSEAKEAQMEIKEELERLRNSQ
jgi:uncharacterized protein YlxW (UPF0749 family)